LWGFVFVGPAGGVEAHFCRDGSRLVS